MEKLKISCKDSIKNSMESSISLLRGLTPLLGDSFTLKGKLADLIESGKMRYDSRLSQSTVVSNDFEIWAKDVSLYVLEFEKQCRESVCGVYEGYVCGERYLDKSHCVRKTILIGFLIAVIIISFVVAGFAIYGKFASACWADVLSEILGIIDFAVGILGFSIERIFDMKAQAVSRALYEIDRTDDLDEAEKSAKKIKGVIKIKNSHFGNGDNYAGSKWKNVKITKYSTSCDNTSPSKDVSEWWEKRK